MKVLVLNPFSSNRYNEQIEKSVKTVSRKDTEITVENLENGFPFIRHAYFQALIVPDIIKRIINAEQEGFDGVFVSCCFEPAVKEAREVVNIPVVGASGPNVFLARQLGQKFGFITDTKRSNAQTYDLFKRDKLYEECVGIKSIDMGVEAIERNPYQNQKKVIEVIKTLVDEGADVIVNGCTVLSAFFKKENIPSELERVPIIDANVGAIKFLEMLIDLHEKDNLIVSRNVYYQNPKEEEPAFYLKTQKKV